MMGGLHIKSCILKGKTDIPSGILPQIHWAQVEISTHIMSHGGGSSGFICMKQKEFAFRACIESIAHISSLLQGAFQDISRVSLKGCPVRAVYITYQPGLTAAVMMPWE